MKQYDIKWNKLYRDSKPTVRDGKHENSKGSSTSQDILKTKVKLLVSKFGVTKMHTTYVHLSTLHPHKN